MSVCQIQKQKKRYFRIVFVLLKKTDNLEKKFSILPSSISRGFEIIVAWDAGFMMNS